MEFDGVKSYNDEEGVVLINGGHVVSDTDEGEIGYFLSFMWWLSWVAIIPRARCVPSERSTR